MSNQLDYKVITLNNKTITVNPKQRLISINILEHFDIEIFEIGYTYGDIAFATIDKQKYIKEAYLKEFCTNTGHRYIDVFNLIPKVETMSSLEIAELTAKRHDHVMRDIRNMIEQLERAKKDSPNLGWHCESSTYLNSQNKSQPCYLLDYNTTVNLLTGYDAAKRMMVIQRWQELENKTQQRQVSTALTIPQNLPDALRLAANLAEEKEQLQKERDDAIRTKGQIGDKKVATAMATAGNLAKKVKALEAKLNMLPSVAKDKATRFATILAIQSRVENLCVNGLKLANFCRKSGLEVKQVDDVRYGRVNSYPAQAWKQVYNIDINRILGV